MNIGEKIKNLRTSKLMTQKELSGDVITRNMLSQIESGSALPSLQTLIYLANRLGVPVGYLVSDGGTNETFYKKYSNYPNIVESYKSGEWEICRDLCIECFSEGGDNEITYMLAQASMHLGMSYFGEGRLKAAVRMFEETLDYSALTVFDIGGILSCVSAHAEIMSLISPSLNLEISKKTESDIICTNDICKFSSALITEADQAIIPSEGEWANPNFFYILSAKSLMENGNYEAAIALLSHVCEDSMLPRPIMYLALDDYEKCCKETGDYKDAYEISQARMQLFEKMLADN
ncbi:MAG: helix-turn-helix transcriptional regulator [Clostridia bacterium]|nr:helix-turn-helix transcriptional regulator [Clostridia bacterium]